MRILDCVGSKDDGEHIAELFPEFRAAGRVRHVDALALAPVATIGLLIVAAPVWAGSIAGGSVTGGSALTAGGKFIDLTVPWGAASVPANTVGPANFMSPNLYAFDEAQNFTLTANLAIQVGLNPISAGTEVNSSFVTFRPSSATENLLGYVEFNSPVLALITSDASLLATNFLGNLVITYEDPVEVGLEAGDLVTIDSGDPNRIDWNTTASLPGDSVRVVRVITAKQQPSTWNS